MARPRRLSVRVATDEDIRAQTTGESPEELIKSFASVGMNFDLPDSAPLSSVLRLAAEKLDVPPSQHHLRFWAWSRRENGAYRPAVALQGDGLLQDLVMPGSNPPTIDLFLERPSPGTALPPLGPSDLLLFVKEFRGPECAPVIQYLGCLVATTNVSIRALMPELRRLAGVRSGVIMRVTEEVARGRAERREHLSSLPAGLRSGDILVVSCHSTPPTAADFLIGAAMRQQQQRQNGGQQGAGQQELSSWQQYQQWQAQAQQQQQTYQVPQQLQPQFQLAPQQQYQQQQQQQRQEAAPIAGPQTPLHGTPQPIPVHPGAAAGPAQQTPGKASPGTSPPPASQRLVHMLALAAQEAGQAAGEADDLRRQLQERAGEVGQLQQRLREREKEVQGLEGRVAQLQGEAQAGQDGLQRLRVLEGDEAACRSLSAAELEDLHDRLEQSTARLRRLLIQRRVDEARAQATAEAAECGICNSAPKDTRLSCGHLLCRRCSERITACPVCRKAVTSRERAFL